MSARKKAAPKKEKPDSTILAVLGEPHNQTFLHQDEDGDFHIRQPLDVCTVQIQQVMVGPLEDLIRYRDQLTAVIEAAQRRARMAS